MRKVLSENFVLTVFIFVVKPVNLEKAWRSLIVHKKFFLESIGLTLRKAFFLVKKHTA